MKPIRASEIGSYLYCRRAWWYQRQGQASLNQAELAAGTELHRRHGRQVLRAGLPARAGLPGAAAGLRHAHRLWAVLPPLWLNRPTGQPPNRPTLMLLFYAALALIALALVLFWLSHRTRRAAISLAGASFTPIRAAGAR